MATIRVKRGTTKPTTANLAYVGEMAFDYTNNVLYARNQTEVVKVGGELERVYVYEGTSYYHSFSYAFNPEYMYKVHIIASTQGTTVDTSATTINYRNSSLQYLIGTYLSIYADDVAATVAKASGRNISGFIIQDAYSNGVTLTSGITKVIDFEISATFGSSVNETLQWVAYGKAVTTVNGQGDAAVTLCDFAHSCFGALGNLYINPGLNLGSPDSLNVTVFRSKRK